MQHCASSPSEISLQTGGWVGEGGREENQVQKNKIAITPLFLGRFT